MTEMRAAPHRPKSFYRGMTYEKAEQARQAYFVERKKQREIAEELGVKQNTVSRIVAGLVW